jgi:CheY-like chemotaxis protein
MQTDTTNVLIVDDDLIIQLLHKRLLQKDGLHPNPLVCNNGVAALDTIDEHCSQPNTCVLLLDINMPVMNGWELLDELNLRNIPLGRIYVIMVTSSVDPLDRLKATEYQHIIGFLEKPLTTQSIHTIRNIPQIKLLL